MVPPMKNWNWVGIGNIAVFLFAWAGGAEAGSFVAFLSYWGIGALVVFIVRLCFAPWRGAKGEGPASHNAGDSGGGAGGS